MSKHTLVKPINRCNWELSPPKYIEAPRRWINGAYKPITDKYIGISLKIIDPFCLSEGKVYWLPSDNMDKLCHSDIPFIYEREPGGDYRYLSQDMRKDRQIHKKCPDCSGKGVYIGFFIIEQCKTCRGKGHI